jgi:hypothetical protein
MHDSTPSLLSLMVADGRFGCYKQSPGLRRGGKIQNDETRFQHDLMIASGLIL